MIEYKPITSIEDYLKIKPKIGILIKELSKEIGSKSEPYMHFYDAVKIKDDATNISTYNLLVNEYRLIEFKKVMDVKGKK